MIEWVIKYQPDIEVWLFYDDVPKGYKDAFIFGKDAPKPYLGGKVFTGEIDQYYLVNENG